MLVALLASQTAIAQNWTQQISGTTNNLASLYFVDSNVGWIPNGWDSMLHTINGGNDWTTQTIGLGPTIGFNSIKFINSSLGYAVGGGGIIAKTTDGGSTWLEQTSGTTEHLFSVYFVDSNTGWAVGWNGIVVNTTDGGNTWNTQSSATSDKYVLDSKGKENLVKSKEKQCFSTCHISKVNI